MSDPLIRAEHLGQRYRRGRREVVALEGIELALERGELVVVRGPSGSGKTTLLLALGGMLRPSSGTVRVDGVDLYAASAAARDRYRARRVGFVFQSMHLLPYLDLVANVALASRAPTAAERRARARDALCELGLEARLDHRPFELSAGERQRAATARALVHEPELVLADEPTGNLDDESARRVLERLATFQRAGGAVVLVTHSRALPIESTRALELEGGRLHSATPEANHPGQG